MERTHGPIERSREPGTKKARLTPQTEDPQSFMGSIPNFQTANDKEIEIQELVAQYRTALEELTFNSKPIITNLTIIAGENLHAAKAIAATICANILEVQSDQKLPSLYLLDSIVKNIGGDYIKYFGSRLPEVFSKAYQQVDPSTHPGMRHLFGTWKGVFPPQLLQMIAKRLAFPHAVGDSSSGSATSRLNSQSQRTGPSIHVNPKYSEARQRLQQPIKDKGLTDDSSVSMVNSCQDADRLDKAVATGSLRQWPEPTLKEQSMHRSQRDAPDEFVRKKNIVAAYRNYDHDPNLSSQSGLEIERVKKRVNKKPCFGVNGNLEEKMSICRNGLDIKQGVPSYEATSERSNVHLLSRNIISGESDSGIGESWKNSDEEEYMWDDLNSKPNDQCSTGISQRHCWSSDGSNRSGLETGLWRPENMHGSGSRINRETSADALPTERKEKEPFRNRRSPSWTDEPHLTDEAIYSDSGLGRFSHSGVANRLSGTSMPANSLMKTPIPSHMSPSHISTSCFGTPIPPHLSPSQIGTSNFGFPPNPELVHSASVGQKRHAASDHLTEQDYFQSQLSRLPEMKKSYFSATANTKSQFSYDSLRLHSQDTTIAYSPKFPSQNLQTSASTVYPVLPRHHIPLAEHSSQYHQLPLPKLEASGNSPPSVMKYVSNQSSINNVVGSTIKKNAMLMKESTTLPNEPPHRITRKDPRLTAGSSKDRSLPTDLSKSKVDPLPLAPGPPPSSQASDSASNPVSSLFSTLVAKGLIPGSKTEPLTSSIQLMTQPLKPEPTTLSTSPVSISSGSVTSNKKVSSKKNEPSVAIINKKHPSKENEPFLAITNKKVLSETSGPSKSTLCNIVSSETNEPTKSVAKCSVEEVNPLISLEFKPDFIRQPHPSVVNKLFEDFPHQCKICGVRLKLEERLERHLEWHALRNPEVNGQDKSSRRWYASQDNWVAGKDVMCCEDRISWESEETEAMVPADESQCVCVLCGEIFDDVYCHKTGEWMFKGAVYLSVPLGDSNMGTSSGSAFKGPIVHANCMAENSLKDLGFPAE